MALNEHADLLRASIASPSNDLRLGAHEAPPAIISAFIGEHLSQILNKITGTDVLQASQHSRRNQKSIPLPKILKSCLTTPIETGHHPSLLPATSLNSGRSVLQPTVPLP
jgi:glutamine synthetase type III